jgi:hypothetical protein
MRLDSKQQIYNDLELVFSNYPNFDLKNNYFLIYEYMETIPSLGSNPNASSYLCFQLKLTENGLPSDNRRVTIVTNNTITEEYNTVSLGYTHFTPKAIDDHLIYFTFGNEQNSYCITYNVKSPKESYLTVTKYNNNLVHEVYPVDQRRFKLEIN